MRCVAIMTGPETHLDHLGVLSALLQIPLFVTDEKNYHLAKEFYPDIDVYYRGFEDLSLEWLAHHFDVIFETGKFWAAELKPLFEFLFRKNMRFVFCPHGNSDKGHSLQNHVEQDVVLVYGDHLLELLKKTKALNTINHVVYTGNYRYSYYLKHRVFFDAIAEEKVFSHFADKKPVLLYAPTWHEKENPTSFFFLTDRWIEQLTSHFNVLIKLHPFLVEDFPAPVVQMISRYEHHRSILFLMDFPLIYPLLARCDLYLGDYSSMGYDFLIFDKPLFFFNPKKETSSSLLHSCGIEIPHDSIQELEKFLLHSMEPCGQQFAIQRKKTYSYVFGKEVPLEQIHATLLKTLTI